jgi:hypothetical protein
MKVPLPEPLVLATALAAVASLVGAPASVGRSDVAGALGVVVVSKSGNGTVTSVRSSAIDCGSRCRAVLPQGTALTLAAKPEGSFDFWGGECSGSARQCQVVVEKRTIVRARFAASDPTAKGNDVRLTVAGRGIVRSDPAGLIECGSVPSRSSCATVLTRGRLTLLATPAPDSIFVRWTGAAGCSTSTTCQIDVGAPRSIAATFQLRSVPDGSSTLRVHVNDPRQGSVRFGSFVCPPTCERAFLNRSIVTLRPESGSFSGWSGSCVGNAPTCVLAISGPALVNATFAIFAVTRGSVRVTRSGPGQVRSLPDGIACGTGRLCSATFARNQEVTLTAAPADARHSVSWPGTMCSGPTCVVPALEGGKDVQVLFTLATDELAVNKAGDGEGQVTSNPGGIDCGTVCTKRFNRGTRVTLKAKASSGSRFSAWSGACTGTGGCSVVVGAAPGQATSVTARFDRIRDEVRVTKSGDGDGIVRSDPGGIACGSTCAATFTRDSRVELRADPDAMSRFVGWRGPCTGTGVCTISRLQGRMIVGARFDRLRDELRIVKTGRGRGRVVSAPAGIACGKDCTAVFTRGRSVTLKAKSAVGSRFAGWSGPCAGKSDCRLTVSGPVTVEARFTPICAAGTATLSSTRVATNPRRVFATIALQAKASVRLRLSRAGRKVKEKTITGLNRGVRTLRLDVPRTASAGKYRLVLRITDACGGTRRFERTVSIPRRS